MTAVSLKKILTDANKNNYAVAGLVVLGWDDALAFTKAADETGVPIILQAGPSCRAHTPVHILGKMFRHLAAQTKTHVCCHIDHGYTFRECAEGIDSGFTSVIVQPFLGRIHFSTSRSSCVLFMGKLTAFTTWGVVSLNR